MTVFTADIECNYTVRLLLNQTVYNLIVKINRDFVKNMKSDSFVIRFKLASTNTDKKKFPTPSEPQEELNENFVCSDTILFWLVE